LKNEPENQQEKKMPVKMLDGNEAAAEAIKLARVKVISAYPITPQSSIAERLSEMIANGELNARYIRVESEHTALSAAIGAQLTGVRTATATSSVGLALMHEILGVASGCRVPIVMPIVNRALVAPWSLWCDHQDTMAERDSGWLQFYVESVQEVLDMLLLSYRIAEHPEILTPTMVCLDGFFLSHSMQKVEVPEQEVVDGYLPEYKSTNLYLDTKDPMFINNLTSPDEFSEMRYQQKVAFENTFNIIPGIQEEFYNTFGRRLQMKEEYKVEDAEAVLITIGSMSGTAKHVVNELREQGNKVGVLRIIAFRPFPVKQILKALKGKKIIGVLDRSAGLGAQSGPLCTEIKAALAQTPTRVFSYIAGLGGRDITEKTIHLIFNELLENQDTHNTEPRKSWIDTDEEAMNLRQVKKNV
jgi:pyruvate ferredoxin oxidoreductase alpha subunit